MILVDANLLLYAYHASAVQHERARLWLEGVLSAPEPVRFSWVTLLAFLRVATNPRIFEYPFSIEEAVGVISALLAQTMVGILAPGERHWTILSDLLVRTQSRGPGVMDAYLAALAMEHGATLCSTDQGFRRFLGLRLLNPLGGEAQA